MSYGRHTFDTLNIDTYEHDVTAGTAQVLVFRDDPNRMGARMWLDGANSAHIVVSLDTDVAVTHTWSHYEEIVTWNCPVVIPWWDKRARYCISRDAAQTLHVIEYVNKGRVP